MYCSALRRLGGVTQVVSAAEGGVLHTRLTHTYEVAQTARRVARNLMRSQKELAEEFELDADVAEAAALAHDIGHPPFGHVAEEELDRLIKNEFPDPMAMPDGFEGNAQTFRVVTKLARRHDDFFGLDLTRATLDAILKYPWLREPGHTTRARKYGAFETETGEFQFARAAHQTGSSPSTDDGERSAEAEIMDWADDVTYAVHDVEDFYRAGLLPLDRVLKEEDHELREIFDTATDRWKREGINEEYDLEEDVYGTFAGLLALIRKRSVLTGSYRGDLAQRAALRSTTSLLIDRYVQEPIGLRLQDPAQTASRVIRDPRAQKELMMLKELIWHYVILNPALATQQHGQRTVIATLFKVYLDDASSPRPKILPRALRQLLALDLDNASTPRMKDLARVRITTDAICGMTEAEAVALYQRLTGNRLGSVQDAILH